MPSDMTRRLSAPLKAWIRRELDRRGLELLADPFSHRVVRMIDSLGIDTVIDGGANVGQFGQMLRSAGYQGRIFSVEPLSSAFETLASAAQADPLWLVERAALSDREGVITMNIAGNSVSSSALPMLAAHSDAAPESTYVGTESVSTTTVDHLVEKHKLDPARTLLKLDVQGYENTVLAGAERTIAKFAAAQLELSFVPLYDGQWLASEVTEFLEKLGYQMWMLDPAAMHDPLTGRTMQCDGIFVRA
jgi:FkbM family methyltransferase